MVWAADERARALKVLQKYPGRAMVVMCHDGRAETPVLKRSKFVCPAELSVAQLMVILRKNVHLDSSQACSCSTRTCCSQEIRPSPRRARATATRTASYI